MEIKDDYGFDDLRRAVWSGAVDTMETVEKAGKENELMQLLEIEFDNDTPTLTQVNDFLWFESDFIYEELDIAEDEDEDEEDEDEDEEDEDEEDEDEE